MLIDSKSTFAELDRLKDMKPKGPVELGGERGSVTHPWAGSLCAGAMVFDRYLAG